MDVEPEVEPEGGDELLLLLSVLTLVAALAATAAATAALWCHMSIRLEEVVLVVVCPPSLLMGCWW